MSNKIGQEAHRLCEQLPQITLVMFVSCEAVKLLRTVAHNKSMCQSYVIKTLD